MERVGELGLRYGRITLVLVEAFYWFLTMPSDTLAVIQVDWIWNGDDEPLFTGKVQPSSAITTAGWRVFPIQVTGPYDSVGLYVSDECAGVHEMIFLSTGDDDRRCTPAYQTQAIAVV